MSIKKAKILALTCFFLPLLNCRAADAPPPASEEALMQKLDRLNEEVAATKQQLETIRSQKPEPVTASKKAAAETAPSTSAEPPNLFSNFVKQVNLRNSVFDKDAFDKPADISYTRPGNGPSSYAIDAGLKIVMQPLFFPWGETLSPSLGIDYHRNTNPGNLMDRVQVGTQFEYTLGSTATSPVALEIT